jgi:hypothetical protein
LRFAMVNVISPSINLLNILLVFIGKNDREEKIRLQKFTSSGLMDLR